MTWVKIPLTQTNAIPSGVLFDTVGEHSWTVPPGVLEISAVAIGGGGGGWGHWDVDATELVSSKGGNGGSLSYANNISVTPGETLTVVVGGPGDGRAVSAGRFWSGSNSATPGGSSIIKRNSTELLVAQGGSGGSVPLETNLGDVSYVGGNGGSKGPTQNGGGGGGGAGGYAQNGGSGSSGGFSIYNQPSPSSNEITGGSATGGNGGGGQSSNGAGGGGVGLYGQSNNPAKQSGRGGSGGENASGVVGGKYGGGGGGGRNSTGDGGQGGVRIIWGEGRFFPNTNTSDSASEQSETTI
jgi:hypothetical protein